MTTAPKTEKPRKLASKTPRNVPPGKPPKGFSWIPVGEHVKCIDSWVWKNGDIEPLADSNYGLPVTPHDIHRNRSGYPIRPLPAARAKPSAKKSLNLGQLSIRWAFENTSPFERTAAAAGYVAGFRAAQRRAAKGAA